MLQVLANKFEEMEQDMIGFESFLFIMRSIELALPESQFGMEFAKQIFEKMLAHDRNYVTMLKNPVNLFLKKGFCGVVKDMG